MVAEAMSVDFEFQALRLTQDLGGSYGKAIVCRRGSVSLVPVIEDGLRKGGYKAPDEFRHFEIELRVPWYRRPFVWALLRKPVAVELWTDDTGEVYHWLFPHCRFRGFKGRTFKGEAVPSDAPDGAGISEGGFWKVDSLPEFGR